MQHFNQWMERFRHELYVTEGLHLEETNLDAWRFFNEGGNPEASVERALAYEARGFERQK